MDHIDIENVDSLTELFHQLAEKYKPLESVWYKNYQNLAKLVQNEVHITDETLKEIWYTRDNSVSSLMQGAPSLEEFEQCKEQLRNITQMLKKEVSNETYQRAIEQMKTLKNEQKLKRMYWALLNRALAVIAPTICTTTVDEKKFTKICIYLSEHFQFKFDNDDNWFLKNQAYLKFLHENLPSDLNDPILINTMTWHLFKEIENTQNQTNSDSVNEPIAEYVTESKELSGMSLNQILYGPPGTGKTYHLSKRFAEYTTDAQVQSRSVWLAEKLESLNWMQILTLCLLDIGQQAKVGEIIKHEYCVTKAGLNGISNIRPIAWSYLQIYTIPESKTVNATTRREPAIFNKTPESYWYLVQENLDLIEDLVELHKELKVGPHSAKTTKRYSCVTFHQSYGYEEFIEGLKAKTTDEDAITYVVEPGAFVKLCRRAEQDPENRYAIFIDEINRGNVSKIFGELITLIEPDKRTSEPNQIEIQLAYSGTPFSVPKNVDIIGTMNTADRSLTMLDTALRRRFDFVEMMPDPEKLGNAIVKDINLTKLLIKLNQRIEVLYDREHTLGHAFFMPVKEAIAKGEDVAFQKLICVFQNKIIPLLQEYFFEDWQKIRLVLGDNQKKDSALQFVTEETLSDQRLKELFGSGHGLNQYGDEQRQFKLKPFASSNGNKTVWEKSEAYLGIYDASSVQISESNKSSENEGESE